LHVNEVLDHTKKTICFIFNKNRNKIIGTGFFVGVKVQEDDDQYQVYLVTAKHVIAKDEVLPEQVSIATNKREEEEPIFGTIEIKDTTYLTHHKESDVIAIPIGNDTRLEFKIMGEEIICTRELFKHLEIKKDDPIVFGGYDKNQENIGKVNPRFKTAKFLSPPQEMQFEIDGYVLDVELLTLRGISYGGFSGAPVYLDARLSSKPDLDEKHHFLYFIGILIGHVEEDESGENIVTITVVPSHILREILFTSDSEKLREKQYQTSTRRHSH